MKLRWNNSSLNCVTVSDIFCTRNPEWFYLWFNPRWFYHLPLCVEQPNAIINWIELNRKLPVLDDLKFSGLNLVWRKKFSFISIGLSHFLFLSSNKNNRIKENWQSSSTSKRNSGHRSTRLDVTISSCARNVIDIVHLHELSNTTKQKVKYTLCKVYDELENVGCWTRCSNVRDTRYPQPLRLVGSTR